MEKRPFVPPEANSEIKKEQVLPRSLSSIRAISEGSPSPQDSLVEQMREYDERYVEFNRLTVGK